MHKKVEPKTHVNTVQSLLGQLRKRPGIVYLKRLSIILDEDSEKGFGLVSYVHQTHIYIIIDPCLLLLSDKRQRRAVLQLRHDRSCPAHASHVLPRLLDAQHAVSSDSAYHLSAPDAPPTVFLPETHTDTDGHQEWGGV